MTIPTGYPLRGNIFPLGVKKRLPNVRCKVKGKIFLRGGYGLTVPAAYPMRGNFSPAGAKFLLQSVRCKVGRFS